MKTGIETTYYVVTYGKQIGVGHDMCAGAFYFDESDNYEVEFSCMDASGNLTPWSGKRIPFTKPKEGDHMWK